MALSPQVKFSPLPQWKARHSLKGVGVRGKKEKGRVPLGSLQPHASTPRLLVGAGSPRPATIGKPAAAKKVENHICTYLWYYMLWKSLIHQARNMFVCTVEVIIYSCTALGLQGGI